MFSAQRTALASDSTFNACASKSLHYYLFFAAFKFGCLFCKRFKVYAALFLAVGRLALLRFAALRL